MQRTIRIRLQPSPFQAGALAETSRQFTSAFNQSVRMGWQAGISNATKLHYLAYYPVKTGHPTLVSDLINQARVKAAETLRSAFALQQAGRKVTMPVSQACPPRYKAVEGRDFKLIRALQKRGTKSAKRHLRKTKRRRARFRRDADHVLSKQIVAAAEPGSTIVLENLKDIRKRMKARRRTQIKRRMHSWPFASLKTKVEYKAEERGCTVVAVDPRHTSQTCSCCGHTARNNRRSQSMFKCRKCGYHLNADLNAARNIAAKYHASVGRLPAGGLCNQPIVSDPAPVASG